MSNIEFIDAETDYKAETTTYRDIIMRHVERIAKLSVMEQMNISKRISYDRAGHRTEEYSRDERDLFITAVEGLECLVIPYFDDEAHEARKAHKTRNKKIWEEISVVDENDKGSRRLRNGERFMYLRRLFKSSQMYFADICLFLKRKRFLDVGSVEE